MNKIYTFWTLCQQYDKIEVPIIQRDYAHGRNSLDAQRIRQKFVNHYLIDALISEKPIELDFLYGSVIKRTDGSSEKGIFIPLDGQQRLTTLFLLHWFIALKESRLLEAKVQLTKFTYETRPSAHNFCRRLLEITEIKDLSAIKKEIEESAWYDDEWNFDPTVRGMLRMLENFSQHKALMVHPSRLFDLLVTEDKTLVYFYYMPLEKFGLTENLYIRMNGRGKLLSSFENFKSEFFKIIGYNQDLLEQVKDKMEYHWVTGLWKYRDKGSFTIDKPFMKYLAFLTQMLYFKDAEFRADFYHDDFLAIAVLSQVYSSEENLRFLIFSMDEIAIMDGFNDKSLLWKDNASLYQLFKNLLTLNVENVPAILIYSTLRFCYLQKNKDNLYDFLRVVRNLLQNTNDKSIREWPKLFGSIDNLISDENVYDILTQEKTIDLLDGFYVPQRREEILKAKILKAFPKAQSALFAAEDSPLMEGNINVAIASSFSKDEKQIRAFNTENVTVQDFDLNRFQEIVKAFKEISKEDFCTVFGDLITSSLYVQRQWGRLIYHDDYQKHPAVWALAIEFRKKNNLSLEDFLRARERDFIQEITKEYPDFSEIRNVKIQLYIYYILQRRILKIGWQDFFRNGFNFGWLQKTKNYRSLFKKGIEGDNYFPDKNPIFQTYSSQFRYTFGLKERHALDAETVSKTRKRNPFQLLKDWAIINAKE